MSTSKPKFVETGLTFDDVLLVPAYSEVLPSEVNLHSKFSKNLNLKSIRFGTDLYLESHIIILDN